jgi:omega-6 fatty acid desaturase (delta-12 desaturase)
MSATLRQRAPGQAEKEQLIAAAAAKEQQDANVRAATAPGEQEKFVPPQFTVKQLLDAIPAHCFHRSAVRSSLYIVQDFIALGLLAWASFNVDSTVAKFNLSPVAYHLTRAAAHTFISIWMGLFGTGLWIIAHECGHQAFSSSKNINNAVGWVLHSILLVPYHSWRISHARHHAATGHMTRDEVFVPKTRSQTQIGEIKEEAEVDGHDVTEARQLELQEAIGDAPLYVLGNLVIQQLFGWPAYLIRNASGQKHYPRFTNHFTPSSIIFRPDHKNQIIWSDIGLLIVLSVLTYWGMMRGFREVLVLYILPYLQVNHWLVGITFLQHTDPMSPHYSAKKWTFARGALTTIDRQFLGPIGGLVLHGICETHVAHHISSKIPHYAAWEATEAIKNYVGEYYLKSDGNFLVDLFKNYRDCRWVEDKGDILFYRNGKGLSKRVGVDENGGVSDSGVDVSADKI